MEGFEEEPISTPEVAEIVDTVKDTVKSVTDGIVAVANDTRDKLVKKLSEVIGDKFDKIINRAYSTTFDVSKDKSDPNAVSINIKTNDPRVIAALASN